MGGVAEIEPNHNGSIMQPTDKYFDALFCIVEEHWSGSDGNRARER